MSKEIQHAFQINRKPEDIVNALLDEKHIQKWWTKDATVRDGKVFSLC
jgi:uncharacterized protein YndB with AHSA1/START domain